MGIVNPDSDYMTETTRSAFCTLYLPFRCSACRTQDLSGAAWRDGFGLVYLVMQFYLLNSATFAHVQKLKLFSLACKDV